MAIPLCSIAELSVEHIKFKLIIDAVQIHQHLIFCGRVAGAIDFWKDNTENVNCHKIFQ